MGSPSDTQFCDLSPVPAQVRETIDSILSFFLEEAFEFHAFLFLPAVPAFPPFSPKPSYHFSSSHIILPKLAEYDRMWECHVWPLPQ